MWLWVLKMQSGVKERYDTFIANMVANGMNGALAVRETPGYSNKYARTTARRLSTIDYIKDGIAKKQAELLGKLHITAEEVVQRFIDVADRAKSASDFVNENRALENLGKHLGIFKESAPHPEREKARRALQEAERIELTRLARLRTNELSNRN